MLQYMIQSTQCSIDFSDKILRTLEHCQRAFTGANPNPEFLARNLNLVNEVRTEQESNKKILANLEAIQ